MPSSRWESIIQSVEVLNRTKRRRKDEFTFCLSWDIQLLLHSDSDSPDFWSFALRLGLTLLVLLIPQFSGLHTQTVVSLPFLVFHPWDSRSWDSSVFKTMWTKSYKSFTIYTLLICFSGELWDNHVLLVFFLFLLMQCIDVSFLL